jgi:hypothetical protein
VDDTQKVDVEIPDNFSVQFGTDLTKGIRSQIIKYTLTGNKDIEEAEGNNGSLLFPLADTAAVNIGDPNAPIPPVRLDPLQVIVNVSWGATDVYCWICVSGQGSRGYWGGGDPEMTDGSGNTISPSIDITGLAEGAEVLYERQRTSAEDMWASKSNPSNVNIGDQSYRYTFNLDPSGETPHVFVLGVEHPQGSNFRGFDLGSGIQLPTTRAFPETDPINYTVQVQFDPPIFRTFTTLEEYLDYVYPGGHEGITITTVKSRRLAYEGVFLIKIPSRSKKDLMTKRNTIPTFTVRSNGFQFGGTIALYPTAIIDVDKTNTDYGLGGVTDLANGLVYFPMNYKKNIKDQSKRINGEWIPQKLKDVFGKPYTLSVVNTVMQDGGFGMEFSSGTSMGVAVRFAEAYTRKLTKDEKGTDVAEKVWYEYPVSGDGNISFSALPARDVMLGFTRSIGGRVNTGDTDYKPWPLVNPS